MSGTHDAIKRVIEAFERSDWAEIDVSSGNVRVHLAARSSDGSSTEPADPTPPPAAQAPPSVDVPAGHEPAAPSLPAGAHAVTAPSPGIFWRAPEPGAPPFADVGDTVEPSSTVCIIEVMKLMNHLKADVDGEVVAVYGRDGVAVQKGEPLFAIVPSGS